MRASSRRRACASAGIEARPRRRRSPPLGSCSCCSAAAAGPPVQEAAPGCRPFARGDSSDLARIVHRGRRGSAGRAGQVAAVDPRCSAPPRHDSRRCERHHRGRDGARRLCQLHPPGPRRLGRLLLHLPRRHRRVRDGRGASRRRDGHGKERRPRPRPAWRVWRGRLKRLGHRAGKGSWSWPARLEHVADDQHDRSRRCCGRHAPLPRGPASGHMPPISPAFHASPRLSSTTRSW